MKNKLEKELIFDPKAENTIQNIWLKMPKDKNKMQENIQNYRKMRKKFDEKFQKHYDRIFNELPWMIWGYKIPNID